MARYDKYDPKNGGYRAPLAADFDPANLEKALAVSHDGNGRVVIGGAKLKGVLVLTKARKAGEIVDVMTSGEIVEFGPSDSGKVPGVDFGVPGTDYFASTTGGVITSTGGAGAFYVGHTVSGQKLVVRFNPSTIVVDT